MYYVDFLCVHKEHRGKKMAPKLIQTHEYNARRLNQSIQVSFFKRESTLTLIKPFIQYKCEMFQNKFPIVVLHNRYKYVPITKQNFYLYVHYIKQTSTKFAYYITIHYINLLTLIQEKQIIIYAVMIQQTILHLYYFKNGDYYYKDKLAIECFGSIAGSNQIEFKQHFCNILHLLSYDYLYLEMISDNKYLYDYLSTMKKSEFNTISAYYFYNYIHKTISSKDVLLII